MHGSIGDLENQIDLAIRDCQPHRGLQVVDRFLYAGGGFDRKRPDLPQIKRARVRTPFIYGYL